MEPTTTEVLRLIPLYRTLAAEDQERLATVSRVATFDRGELLFAEGDPSEHLFTVARGRVKVTKLMPDGREVILEIFGPGDPVGAVAVYEDVPYPATAVALQPTICLKTPKGPFFELLESRPSLVRGLLMAMTHRVVMLTNRLAERTAGRAETRFARLFLKLSEELGRPRLEGIFIPMALTRQELADLMGTTVETSIRIMSRWGKEGIVQTEKEGFFVADRQALEEMALS